MDEIWILGATGRIGRAVAARLVELHRSVVLVGRDEPRLRALARELGDAPSVLTEESLEGVARRIAERAPAVVVNTVGPFGTTGPLIADSCPAGTHYVDLANELPAVTGMLDRHDAAAMSGHCVVTGAGFGVLGTESAILQARADRSAPVRVRVDALAEYRGGGTVGAVLAETMVDVFAGGGFSYRSGRLTPARLGGGAEQLTLPDGRTATTAAAPSGELVAAQRGSGAPEVVAASKEIPAGRMASLALPIVGALLRVPPLRRAAVRLLAGIEVKDSLGSREPTTWARARATWADGSDRVVWLRADDGMDFTAAVAAEVADRLVRGAGRPGAYTPGALFGPDLAEAAGGTFLVEDRVD
ncbi:saccharopine dehydrogenase family protein [Microlunatus parietis]|uniref:Short subunit dehydrogenase-like uncharacterized protein n=1 Tax=Microlunatus parietis TaxID=682979 RepID=A0A7Y9LD95_9ACTN|nr:hypothetical protein [Microlunatus parietis]NYE72540.1 short subunit dehydrogenase-like uncharacterized protein [Microlunatus parietis]